jgi:predicted permease
MVPARQAWQSSPLQMIKGGPVGSINMGSMRLRRFALRDLLLGAQITICTLLVTASLVAVRGMERALHVPLGIQPQGAMLVDLDQSQAGQAVGRKAIIEATRNTPGVVAAGAVNRTPFTGGLHGVPVYRPGTTEFTLTNSALAPYVFTMSPGYLEAAGTRLLRGRDFSWHDTPNTPHVAIVNQTFGRKMWGNNTAMGQRFLLLGNLTEVVGVAEDGKYHDLQEAPQPVVYLSLSQGEESEGVLVVRSRLTPKEITAALQGTLGGIAPNAPVTVQSWTDTLESELFPARAATVALGVMGLLAAMLSVTGIFGMAAYSVSRRMKELGIRVALGARRTQVMGAAVGRPMLLLGAGSALGLLTGILTGRLLAQIVYQANPGDPAVLGGAVLTMALLGIAASAVPARRALAVDPSKLMREE